MNTKSTKTPTSKTDRKTIEKNRRNLMKCLHSQLNSLVHLDASSSREPLTLPDQIEEATGYIKKLEENIAELKQQKNELVAGNGNYSSRKSYTLNSPVQIEVQEKEDNVIEVILITGLECQFVFGEAVRIVHEEHAEVVNATYSVVGSTVFHSIHAKIREMEDTTNDGISRITERLKKFAL